MSYRGERVRSGRWAAVAAAALLASVVCSASAEAALTAAGPLDPLTAFPAWYQDTSGTQLQLCIADPGCPISPTVAAFVAPDGEAFYSLVNATVDGPAGQSATVEMALEAAFLPAEVTFSRLQVTLDGMEPNSAYTVTYPYGSGTWNTDATGRVVAGNRAAQRVEVGCAASPCNFNAVLGTGLAPFATWDPAQSAPPAGYIGDGLTPHAIVGPPTSFVTVEGPGLPVGGITTNLFTVEGKLAAPPVGIFFAAPGSGDFGTQRVASATPRTITVKNNGLAALPAFSGVAVQGADAPAFSTGADTCSGTTLGSGQSCKVVVMFTPDAAGARSSSLVLTQADGATDTVPLTGTGGLPGLAADPGVVNFFNQPVGTTSPELQVKLDNTGDAALSVADAAITGPAAKEFGVSSNSCKAAVAPGASCTLGLRFLPAANGVRDASLVLKTDAGAQPYTVPVSGTGTGGPTAGSGKAPPRTGPTVLALTGLRARKRVARKEASLHGLKLAMTLQPGTRVVRFRVYRRSGNRRKLVWQAVRTPGAAGEYRVKLDAGALRRALGKRGTYEVEVVPGLSPAALGTASRLRVTVV